MSDPSDLNMTENPGGDTDRPSAAITRTAAALQNAIAASPQGDLSTDAGPADDALPQAELADLAPQLAERGIDLGALLTAMVAEGAPGKAKPKPTAGQAAAGHEDDPAVLLNKLAQSLGISPAELLKRLGPVFKELLATGSVRPRRKPKKDSTQPAAKPKPKPKPKTASKPNKETAKPAAKPKPKPKTASKPSKEPAKPAAKPKPKPKGTSRTEPIAQ